MRKLAWLSLLPALLLGGCGIDKEKGKAIAKEIKASKLKVQAQIMDDQVRVTGKKRDDLQEAIQLLKGKDFGLDLQFINMRS